MTAEADVPEARAVTPLSYETPPATAGPGRGFWRLMAVAAAMFAGGHALHAAMLPMSWLGFGNLYTSGFVEDGLMLLRLAVALATSTLSVLTAAGAYRRPRVLAVAVAATAGVWVVTLGFSLLATQFSGFRSLFQLIYIVGLLLLPNAAAGLAFGVAFWHPAARAAMRR